MEARKVLAVSVTSIVLCLLALGTPATATYILAPNGNPTGDSSVYSPDNQYRVYLTPGVAGFTYTDVGQGALSDALGA